VTSAVWGLQWRLALTRKRIFILNVVVPLTVVLPIATEAVPRAAAAGVYAVLFAAFAVFGSALPLRWDGQRGMSARVTRSGASSSSYLLQRAGAGAILDTLQLAPALWLAAIAAGATLPITLRALIILSLTVWVCGLLGILIAAASRSITETALFAAVAVPLLAHMSGVFRTPDQSLATSFESVSPLRALHEVLLEITMGVTSAGATALLAWAIVLPGIVWLLAGRILTALARTTRGGLEGA
jgi:hypothetical protein